MLKELKSIGLTDGESKVYLSLLKLGSSKVGPVVKNSGVSYSKIYEVLGRLIEKGLVSFIVKEKTKYFQAIAPNRLLEFLEQKEKEIEENKNNLKKILPILENIKDKSIIQDAEVFLGFKGLRTAYEVLIGDNKKEDLLFFYLHDERYAEDTDLFYKQEFHYFKKEGIKLRGIANSDFKKSKNYKRPPSFVELKFVDSPLPSMIDIYNGRVLLTMWRDTPIGILIQSQETYENFKSYFEELWKIAKK